MMSLGAFSGGLSGSPQLSFSKPSAYVWLSAADGGVWVESNLGTQGSPARFLVFDPPRSAETGPAPKLEFGGLQGPGIGTRLLSALSRLRSRIRRMGS